MAATVYEVNGHRIVMREHFPAREYHRLIDDLQKMVNPKVGMSFEEKVGIYSQFIESWDYDGPVNKIETWEAMDGLRDLGGIATAIASYVGEMGQLAKNAGSAPTTT